MKKLINTSKFTFIIFLTNLLLITSCSKEENNQPSVTNPGVSGGTSGGSTTTGGTSGTTSTEICSGDSSDGYDDNPNDLQSWPLHTYQIGVGGQEVWRPGLAAFRPEDLSSLRASDQSACQPLSCIATQMADRTKRSNKCYYCLKQGTGTNATYVNTPYANPVPLMKDVWQYSDNDGDIFFRLRLRSPTEINLNGYGGAYCYGRQPNQYGSYVPYTSMFTKIKVDVYARVIRKNTNCNINTNCTENDFTVTGSRYPIRMGLEISSNMCSPILRLPFSLLASDPRDAIVVEFANVQTNASCSAGSGTFCALNTANCWFATLQIATNQTHFFKGYNRADITY